MKIINYTLYNTKVDVHLSNAQTLVIYFNQNSGKAYYRYKIDTISQVKHPGIFIGVDMYNNPYFIHNHYQIGTTALVTQQEFDKGNPIYLYSEKCSNAPLTIVNKVFQHLMNGERYNFLTYNCQTMVNDVCQNKHKSEDVEKWVGGVAITSLAFLLIGAIFGSK